MFWFRLLRAAFCFDGRRVHVCLPASSTPPSHPITAIADIPLPGAESGCDAHTDDSDLTVNICLAFRGTGGSLGFDVGGGRAPLLCAHATGHAFVHRGSLAHSVAPMESGERVNLVLFVDCVAGGITDGITDGTSGSGQASTSAEAAVVGSAGSARLVRHPNSVRGLRSATAALDGIPVEVRQCHPCVFLSAVSLASSENSTSPLL